MAVLARITSMKLDLFDSNLYLGRPTRSVASPAANPAELLAALDQQETRRALVWHVSQRDASALTGNALLSQALAVAPADRLWGCWTLLPPQTDNVLCDGFFAQMKRQRIVALRVFPTPHNYLLDRVVFGRWLDEIAERRIPLLLSLEKGASWPAVYHLLEQYPRLTCVLCDIGIWGVDRFTWPLLGHYPNVYVETSLLALEDGGLEATVAHVGADRLLYGSAYPERYPESAILQLLHAEISDSDRQKIAGGNLERLIAQAQFE
jgi:predicted TIM-barrel fold metal-dependent hydrolase